MSDAPIACTLSAGDFKQRLAAIAELNREALRGHQRGDLTLDLFYAPDAATRVRDMVRREEECCAFLQFDVAAGAEAVRVRITAPEEARVAAETLFEQFIVGSADAPRCGCC
jgi:hypothetical protein